MPRCPNGSRKNPKTGVCESKSKSKSKSPDKTRKNKSVSGVAMPAHRIPPIMNFQRRLYGDRITEEGVCYYGKAVARIAFQAQRRERRPRVLVGKGNHI